MWQASNTANILNSNTDIAFCYKNLRKTHRKEVKNINKISVLYVHVLSHLPLLKLFLNHYNYWPEKIILRGVQMTEKTVAITIQDQRSLWNSSNPEEDVYLLILNIEQQPFDLHTSTSCSPPSIHPSPHYKSLFSVILPTCILFLPSVAPPTQFIFLFPTLPPADTRSHLSLWQLQILSTYSPPSVAACITFSPSIHLLLRIAHTLKHGAYMAPHAV